MSESSGNPPIPLNSAASSNVIELEKVVCSALTWIYREMNYEES